MWLRSSCKAACVCSSRHLAKSPVIASSGGRILTFAGLLVFVLATGIGDQARGAGPDRSPKEWSVPAEQTAEIVYSVYRYTNEARAQEGLKPLHPSSALSYLARHQSDHMCHVNELRHESNAFPKGWQTFSERLRMVGLSEGGENVALRTAAANPDQWAKRVVKGWMKSPEHRRNILRSEFRYIGVGVEACRKRIIYVTEVFSRNRGREPH
jgi:uncharacterized protein YkwD